MIDEFKNHKAALDFIERYDKEATALSYFPFGYRGIGFEYRSYEIRLKPFGTYNIFFAINAEDMVVIILRILKDQQHWQSILKIDSEYHF